MRIDKKYRHQFFFNKYHLLTKNEIIILEYMLWKKSEHDKYWQNKDEYATSAVWLSSTFWDNPLLRCGIKVTNKSISNALIRMEKLGILKKQSRGYYMVVEVNIPFNHFSGDKQI